MRYYYLIDRNPADHTATVTIKQIDQRSATDIRPGATVMIYETSNVGATRSARRAIRKLERAS